MPPTQAWRRLARSFSITDLFIRRQRLPEDFKPQDAIMLHEEALSMHERSILSFLLHVWNRYDFSFELSEVAGWTEQHQRAFSNWASGRTLGRPCSYF